MWDYRKKQKKKIALLEKVGSNETGTGFLQEDTVPTGCAERSESVEMTHCRSKLMAETRQCVASYSWSVAEYHLISIKHSLGRHASITLLPAIMCMWYSVQD